MQIKIQARGFSLSQALQEYIESKIRLALSRYSDRLSRIDVTLLDINGPKGGEDMRCRILCRPEGGESIVIEETAEDMYDAINACAHRMKRATDRHFTRLQSQRRAHLLPI